MTLPTWNHLECTHCSTDRFVQLFQLRSHPNEGTSTSPVGWRCAECGNDADMASLVAQLRLKQKKAELDQMQQEIRSLTPPPKKP